MKTFHPTKISLPGCSPRLAADEIIDLSNDTNFLAFGTLDRPISNFCFSSCFLDSLNELTVGTDNLYGAFRYLRTTGQSALT
jgi:hypothetical protein